MTTTNNHRDEVKDIAEALFNKSKRSFHNVNRLYKQAYHFSPFYRDFVLKVIKNSALKIENEYEGGSYRSGEFNWDEGKLSKRGKGMIKIDITDIDTLPHELGHAVDYWFGRQTLTSYVVLSNGKTLRETLTEEFDKKFGTIFESIMDEFAFIVDSNIQNNAFDILMRNRKKYKELEKTVDPIKRKQLHKELYESGFVDVYYQLYTKKWDKLLNEKYGPVIDAISSRIELNDLFLMGHTVEYYKRHKGVVVQEFFANLFAEKVTSEHVAFNELRRLLPESFAAFEELFYFFYDRLMNNKRFTDVKIKDFKEVDLYA